MIRAIDVEITDTQGPIRSAVSAEPTACPLVQPGRGMLNIIIIKEKAEYTAIDDIFFIPSSSFALFIDIFSTGIETRARTIQVEGLR